MDTLERERCIRGYHIYVHIWETAVGEVLDCRRKPDNANDSYAMAVVKSDMIVGHLPRKLSHILSLFARRGGVIRCFSLIDALLFHGSPYTCIGFLVGRQWYCG